MPPDKYDRENIYKLIDGMPPKKYDCKYAYKNGIGAQYIKVITFDPIYSSLGSRDPWEMFVLSVLEENFLAKGLPLSEIRQPLRKPRDGRVRTKITSRGAVDINSKELSDREKTGLSKKTSVTVTSVLGQQEYHPFAPPLFGVKKQQELLRKKTVLPQESTGVIFFSNNTEGSPGHIHPSLILSSDKHTYARPFDSRHDIATAAKTYRKKRSEGVLFPSIQKLIDTKNTTTYNEVLARLKWVNDKSHIGIFLDTLESRMIAQLRAIDLQNNIEEEVGISFYLYDNPGKKIFEYTGKEQTEDLKKGLSDSSETIKSIAIMICFLSLKDFDTFALKEEIKNNHLNNAFISLLQTDDKISHITTATKTMFLEKCLSITLNHLSLSEKKKLFLEISKELQKTKNQNREFHELIKDALDNASKTLKLNINPKEQKSQEITIHDLPNSPLISETGSFTSEYSSDATTPTSRKQGTLRESLDRLSEFFSASREILYDTSNTDRAQELSGTLQSNLRQEEQSSLGKFIEDQKKQKTKFDDLINSINTGISNGTIDLLQKYNGEDTGLNTIIRILNTNLQKNRTQIQPMLDTLQQIFTTNPNMTLEDALNSDKLSTYKDHGTFKLLKLFASLLNNDDLLKNSGINALNHDVRFPLNWAKRSDNDRQSRTNQFFY